MYEETLEILRGVGGGGGLQKNPFHRGGEVWIFSGTTCFLKKKKDVVPGVGGGVTFDNVQNLAQQLDELTALLLDYTVNPTTCNNLATTQMQ